MFAFVNNIYRDKGTRRVVNNWKKLIAFIVERKILLFNEWEEEWEKDQGDTVQISSSGSGVQL